MSILGETRRRLREWGRWHADGLSGYPRQSAFANYGRGSVCTFPKEIPDDVLEIERVICRAQKPHRNILATHYTIPSPARLKALLLGFSKSTYYAQLEAAEWFVHTAIDSAGHEVPYFGHRGRRVHDSP